MTKLRILALFVLTRAIALAATGASQSFVPKGRWFAPRPFDPYDPRFSFLRWDARWYQSITDNGYSFEPGRESNVAFFPAYPLAARTLGRLVGDTVLAGLLLSNVCSLLASVLFYRLVESETEDKTVADISVALLILSPVGFFFSIFYTEGLFLLASVACVAFARRGRFGVAALCCAVASATKTVGILVMIPFAMALVDAVREKTTRPASLFWLLVAPAGLVLYMLYLHDTFGNALTFMEAERAWGREVTAPWVGFWRLKSRPLLDRSIAVLTFASAVALIVVLFRKNVWRGYGIYSAVFFIANVSTGVLSSLPRHTSAIFPLYMALGLVAREHRFAASALIIVFGLLFLASAAAFVNGYRVI